jgi:hypothetical protein
MQFEGAVIQGSHPMMALAIRRFNESVRVVSAERMFAASHWN